MRLLADGTWGAVVYAGDRLIAHTSSSTPPDLRALAVRSVGSCGEDPSFIAEVDLAESPLYGVAAGHAVRVTSQGDIAWVDAVGPAPSHSMFSDVVACVAPVAGGLVTQDIEGAVVFHPSPGDAGVLPIVLVDGAIAPDFPFSPFPPAFDLAECSELRTKRPVVDGDGVLVAESGGPLLRISLPDRSREVLVDGPVGEFVVLEDPRYLLWRGASKPEPEPDDDCCAVHLLDRETGGSEPVASGLIVGDVSWAGQWLSTYGFGSDLEQFETLRNYVTGATVRLDGWWDLQAGLSATDVLLRAIGRPETRILDITTGELVPVDFPSLAWPERTYEDGVVALALDDPDDRRGDVVRLRFGSRQPERLAADVPTDWVRTHGGNLLFIDRDADDESGPLVLVEKDTTRRELATDVTAFAVPHHGTERERNEVIYSVAQGPARGTWRFVLP